MNLHEYIKQDNVTYFNGSLGNFLFLGKSDILDIIDNKSELLDFCNKIYSDIKKYNTTNLCAVAKTLPLVKTGNKYKFDFEFFYHLKNPIFGRPEEFYKISKMISSFVTKGDVINFKNKSITVDNYSFPCYLEIFYINENDERVNTEEESLWGGMKDYTDRFLSLYDNVESIKIAERVLSKVDEYNGVKQGVLRREKKIKHFKQRTKLL
jgi:hypothetical protein